ncbi:MAG: diguanylate cyclase [Nitrospirae bacterium]|nr:diguanylate cyclase [Nitrospirota bacterium]
MDNISALIPAKSAIDSVINPHVKEFPAVSVVVVKLLQMANNDNTTLDELAAVVETEPSITVGILKIVNSPAYITRRSNITGIKEAIQVLGVSTILAHVLEITFYEQIYKGSGKAKFERLFFWQHCLATACLSRAIAEDVGYPNSSEAYLAGLLHDMGKIIIEMSGRISYSDFLDNLPKINGLLLDEEVKLIGMGHDDIGAFYSHLWEFPEFVTLAIKLHHRRFDHLNLSEKHSLLVSIVSFANLITWTQGIGSVDMIRHPILQPETIQTLDITRIKLHKLLFRLDTELKNLAGFYNFTFPAVDVVRENLLRANIALSKKTTEFFYHNNDSNEQKPPHRLSKSLTATHSGLDLSQIVDATLRAIQADFSYDHLYLMKMDKNTRSLTVKAYIDASSESKNPRHTINITPYLDGFIECLRKKTPVIIHGATTEELQVLNQFGIKEMGIVPLTNNNQVLGIIGVDNADSGLPIQPHDLAYVSMVANELGMAMEHAALFKRLRIKATIDSLTRVFNRGSIDGLLKSSFRKAVENNKTVLSVGMIDIDHFKKFNDSFGHPAGDGVLKLVASTIVKYSRPGDYVGRYGGEEFLIVLNDTTLDNALFYAERLRKEVEKLGKLLVKRFKGHLLTISIGVTTISSLSKKAADLVDNADKALYTAKDQGRNRVIGIMEGLVRYP